MVPVAAQRCTRVSLQQQQRTRAWHAQGCNCIVSNRDYSIIDEGKLVLVAGAEQQHILRRQLACAHQRSKRRLSRLHHGLRSAADAETHPRPQEAETRRRHSRQSEGSKSLARSASAGPRLPQYLAWRQRPMPRPERSLARCPTPTGRHRQRRRACQRKAQECESWSCVAPAHGIDPAPVPLARVARCSDHSPPRRGQTRQPSGPSLLTARSKGQAAPHASGFERSARNTPCVREGRAAVPADPGLVADSLVTRHRVAGDDAVTGATDSTRVFSSRECPCFVRAANCRM